LPCRIIVADSCPAELISSRLSPKTAPILIEDRARGFLGDAMRSCGTTRPFETVAIVILPDHLHAIWTLPDGDADFSTRWSFIKSAFTRAYLAAGGNEQPLSDSRQRHRRRGVWQRRYWEHQIRDEADLRRHVDYIHWNPIKHNQAACPARLAMVVIREMGATRCLRKELAMPARRKRRPAAGFYEDAGIGIGIAGVQVNPVGSASADAGGMVKTASLRPTFPNRVRQGGPYEIQFPNPNKYDNEQDFSRPVERA
jgi:REP element-mobilizing transposase RayT